jgi:hypothetical protein
LARINDRHLDDHPDRPAVGLCASRLTSFTRGAHEASRGG